MIGTSKLIDGVLEKNGYAKENCEEDTYLVCVHGNVMRSTSLDSFIPAASTGQQMPTRKPRGGSREDFNYID